MSQPSPNRLPATPGISVIVPVLNERALVEELVVRLSGLQAEGADVVVVDGGSEDGTDDLLVAHGIPVLRAAGGRAGQMNAGAAYATGDVLLFLHADTCLPRRAIASLQKIAGFNVQRWGRFDLRIEGRSRWLPLIATFINLRSRLTGIATGDQGIFVHRVAFERIGGFPLQPLMEDVELSARLRRSCGFPACLRPPVVTSGRRWDTRGVWKTIVLMWRLRWQYWRGVPAEQLAGMYR